MGIALTLLGLVALAAWPWWVSFLVRRAVRLASRLRERVAPARQAESGNRPIEEIAADVRARALRFRALPEHASYAKRAALTSAYDLVLGECCDSLGQPHLLGVVAPGPDLDRERRRVELLLHSFGMPVLDAA